jgi:hypothetical protein
VAAAVVARSDLTLSHYDARGHLIVARRIADSLTPGWRQIGAVWLPLPHLLNAVPVQIDLLYRTGAFTVALSVASFAVAAGALASIVATVTRSRWAAGAAAAVFVMNPNVLYLQATPMTEPLLLALMLAALAFLIDWCMEKPDLEVAPPLVGVLFGLACLTRYEAWPVTAFALTAAAWALARTGRSWPKALHMVGAIGIYPAAAILGFMMLSRATVGEWFVTGGFFVADNPALGQPLRAAGQVLLGVRTLSGTVLTAVALVGLLGIALRAIPRRAETAALLALSPLAAGSLPWLAFFQGHPHRIRYMVPLLAAQAIGVGAAAARWNGAAPVAALVLVLVGVLELGPDYGAAPMAVEAQWDAPNAAGRRHVTACLEAEYDGTTIMASMGSLGHYMQELSGSGFSVRDFLHEGNGDIWLAALNRARPFAGWVMVEERAEGGDMLAALARGNPDLLDGFSRACEGGGVALYRRNSRIVPRE